MTHALDQNIIYIAGHSLAIAYAVVGLKEVYMWKLVIFSIDIS